MKHGKHSLGYPVGGYKHGATKKEGRFVFPYPADMSDYDGGDGELRPDMPTFAGGGAGGYPASTHKGKSKA